MEQKEKKYEGTIDAGRSVLDIAADMEKRKGFLRHLEATGKKLHEPEQ